MRLGVIISSLTSVLLYIKLGHYGQDVLFCSICLANLLILVVLNLLQENSKFWYVTYLILSIYPSYVITHHLYLRDMISSIKSVSLPRNVSQMSMPCDRGFRISSKFGPRWGRMHEGIDIALPDGSNVYASRSGKVIISGRIRGYGNCVQIDHGNGIKTCYGHLSKIIVNKGDRVREGQLIALSGNTGRSTGPHLHFGVSINDRYVDPYPLLFNY